MRRLFTAFTVLAGFSIAVMSCGPPDSVPGSNGKFATKTQSLTVSPMLISSLPTANRTGLYFKPESAAGKQNWPTHSLYLNSLTEWVKDHRNQFNASILYRPFFYRAEFFFDANEMWQVMTRVNTADTAELGVYANGAIHEAEDWNRYGFDPALVASSGSGGNYDNKAPLISPCSGKIFHKGFSTAGFGNQVYVICKFLAPWRTQNSGFTTLEDGHEFLLYKTSHLSEMTNKNVGDSVTLGEFIGKVGNSGTPYYHLHNAIHRENMLMRCDQSGKEDASGDYICARTFNGANTVHLWPTTTMAGNDRGFSFIRDHYYDPLEFIKARSGNLIYSKLLNSAHANNGVLIANHGIGPVQEAQTIVVTLNNRDYPKRGTTAKPPLTKITIYNATGAKQVFAGAEEWSDQDRRVVLRNVQPGWAYRLKLEIKNQSTGTTLNAAKFQFYITSYPNSNPTLGHYGKKDAYPVVARRSGLGSNLGQIYLDNKGKTADNNKNQMKLFNYLKVAHDHALLTCENRYFCNYNRYLTRCEAAQKLATFMNYGYDSRKENPFTDLKPGHGCYPAAQTLYHEKAIISSSKPFAFNPNGQVNRATAVTMIIRALYGEPSQSLPSRFSDIKQTDWYNPYFTKAKDEKIIGFGTSGLAKPTELVPAAHFIMMLLRSMGMVDTTSTILTYTAANGGQLTERDGVGGGYCSGCTCTDGQKAQCGQSAGACKEGYVECINGKWDTTCKDEIKPKPEECNGIDDDCDGAVDNISGTSETLTRDCELPDCGTKGKQVCSQGQWQTCSAATCTFGPKCTDNDKDGYGDGPDCMAKDCDDSDPMVNPRQTELCNGKDDDCDGQIDNFGKPVSEGGQGLNAKGCFAAPCGNPGKQLCVNGQWDICDAAKCPDPCIDNDLDGYFANASDHCPGPKDCDDSDPNIHPGADEECNGKDNNCDGHIDNNAQGDATPLTMYCYKPPCGKKIPITCQSGKWEMCGLQKCPDCIDQDGDGYKVGGAHCGPTDCDDTRKDINQGAPEICDGKDNDCDGKIDNLSGSDDSITRSCSLSCGAQGTQTCESLTTADPNQSKASWSTCQGGCIPCEDKDNDGASTGSPSCSPIDCDGSDPKVYPGAPEICDGKDNDCDGMVDNIGGSKDALQKVCTNPQCGSKGTQTCTASQSGPPTWSACSAVCKCEDKDGDGFKVGGAHCGPKDCDDSDPGTNQFNLETCDGKDNDCNGKVDDGITCDCQKGQTKTCYTGPQGTANKGSCREGTQTCIDNPLGGTTWSKCTGEVKPQAETCNGLDDDCDGQLDNGVNCGCKPGDTRSCGGQNIGQCKAGTQTCTALGNWSACTGAIQAQPEICDGKDNDCDGQVDESLTKSCYTGPAAHAGVGICKQGYLKCVPDGKGGANWGTACFNEIKALPEQCDGADNDCDGQVDENLTQACYTGPAGTGGYGQCNKGTQTCAAGQWGTCTGEGRPGTEVCDGIDNDCDGLIDNKGGTNQRLTRSCTRQPCGYKGIEMCNTGQWIASSCTAPQCPVANCTDADGDGYDGTGTGANCKADCNDNDPQVHPGKIEFCDGKDNDCDGKIDVDSTGKPVTQFCSIQCKDGSQQAGTKSCDINTGKLGPCVTTGSCPVCEDSDKDGYGVNGAADCRYPGIKDCDDKDASRRPDGVEICDGKDNDCDGKVDNQKGTNNSITKNCIISPCGNPGTIKCTAGKWETTCIGQACVSCGDGTCSSPTENCSTCPADCSCPSDKYCKTSLSPPACISKCGNKWIDPGETCTNCPQDIHCPTGRICKNHFCVPVGVCGDGNCDNHETCSTCPSDCKCSSGYQCQTDICVRTGGGCSNCTSNQVCYNNQCCTPSCSSLSCGKNGCGGTCQCPSGYQCDGNGRCTTSCSCGSKVCGVDKCGNPCGTCPSNQTCNSSGQCVSTCNCTSKQYCDNGSCKDIFTLNKTTNSCYTKSGTTICLKLRYNGGTSFTATVTKTSSWSGNQIKLMIYNPERFFCCSQCNNDFSNSTVTPTGTSSITKSLNISCMKIGETMPVHAEILSPPSCTSCSYHSGVLRITRNK